MKEIPLTPYPGKVLLTKSREEFLRQYKRMTGEPTSLPKGVVGRAQPLMKDGFATMYLVYANSLAVLAHEMSHVCLMLFHDIGSDPREGGGEPFCYLMEHLMRESR